MNEETVLSGPGGDGPATPAAADIDAKIRAEAIRRGLITVSQGNAAVEEARAEGVPLLDVLLRKHLLTEEAARGLDEELKEDFVPGFRILSKLGEGGMGIVYRALQKRLDRVVALKVVMPHLAADPSYLKRFEREARAVAKLNHPSIVAAYDYGESNGRVYLAMEFVEGTNAAEWVRAHGPMSEERALAVVRDVASGLAHAHAAGILHRDVKPANILLSTPRPGETGGTNSTGAKITDLGLARSADAQGSSDLTAAGAILGTPGYMAPEQAFGREIDQRADIYALGATLYQLLTGMRPFEAPTPVAVIARQQTDLLRDPRDLAPGIAAASVALLQGMLAREPGSRYPGWKEVLSDLDRVRRGEAPLRAPPPASHASIGAPLGGGAGATVSAAEATMISPPPESARFAAPAAGPPSPAAAPPPPPARRSKGPLIAVAAVILLAAVAFAVKGRKGPKEGGPGAAPPVGVVKPAKPAPPATPAPAEENPYSPEDRARFRKLLEDGDYEGAEAGFRRVKERMGPATPREVAEALLRLEKARDRAPEERGAFAAALKAREAGDAEAVLAALDGYEGKYGFSWRADAANHMRAWAEGELPLVTLATEPAGGILHRDGRELGPAPHQVRVKPGPLSVEARAPGRRPAVSTFTVEKREGQRFLLTLPEPDPVARRDLVPAGNPRPLWTGASFDGWRFDGGGRWGASDPKQKAFIAGVEGPEPAMLLRGSGEGIPFISRPLALLLGKAAAWKLEWQMFGEQRPGAAPTRVEMQVSGAKDGSLLVLGVDGAGAYLGRRDAAGALERTHGAPEVKGGARHSFTLLFDGTVHAAEVDGKPLGAAAAPAGGAADPSLRFAVEGGTGFFSDLDFLPLKAE